MMKIFGYYRKDGDRADVVYRISFYENGNIDKIHGPNNVFDYFPQTDEQMDALPEYLTGMFIGPIDVTTGNTRCYERMKKEMAK